MTGDIRVVFGRLSRSPLKERGEFDFVCDRVEGALAVVGMMALCPCCAVAGFFDFSAGAVNRFAWNGSEEQPSLNEPLAFPYCAAALEWRLVRGVWIAPP